MSDDKLQTELELEQMKRREKSIGHGGLPSAESAPPPPEGQIGRQGDLEGEGSASVGGGKKKSSKQKFEERQVGLSI
jgi:hypothetical protein